MHFVKAQGATEYLVLLAVVLIVALVSVALLGFFPGMASDAQITQSQTYWRSASPIAITEAAANVYMGSGANEPYIRLKNNGAYPIRITAFIGGDGLRMPSFWSSGNAGCNPAVSGLFNFSDYTYLAPGEETYYGEAGAAPGIACNRYYNYIAGASGANQLGGATSLCQFFHKPRHSSGAELRLRIHRIS